MCRGTCACVGVGVYVCVCVLVCVCVCGLTSKNSQKLSEASALMRLPHQITVELSLKNVCPNHMDMATSPRAAPRNSQTPAHFSVSHIKCP